MHLELLMWANAESISKNIYMCMNKITLEKSSKPIFKNLINKGHLGGLVG